MEAQARVMVDGNWTSWSSFGRWSPYLEREGAAPVTKGAVNLLPDSLVLDSKTATQAQLRIYLYLKFFAGVGFDYSVIAFKLGIYGQISMDMQFQWLNRPYMNDQGTIKNTADGGTDGTLDGQRVRIDGEIGLEFLVKFLFVSFNKVLFS